MCVDSFSGDSFIEIYFFFRHWKLGDADNNADDAFGW